MQNNSQLSCCTLWLWLLIASIINISPLLLFNAGGDSQFHWVLIQCFAEQFWQGDIYPRWCMEANSGLGAPAFLFYFPLPYYAASLLYPLTYAGLSVGGIYIASLFVATMLTAYTGFRWLCNITTAPKALLAVMLMLFLPYRMEAMLFRAGYAEIWAMALIPLLLTTLRAVVRGHKQAVAGFAASLALMLLTHVPVAIVMMIASSIYILIMAQDNRWKTFMRCKVAGLWGIGMSLFYIVPAIYFRQFMLPPEQVVADTPWANGFMTWQNLADQGRVVIGDLLSMIVLFVMAMIALYRIKHIEDSYQRRELRAWLVASFIASILLCPVSAPLYDTLKPWSGIVFPWRMQAVFIYATAFILALWLEWFLSAKRLKTWKADYGMLCALMILLSFFMVGVRPDDTSLEDNIMQAKLIAEPEYQTMWQDKKHFNDDYIFQRLKKKPPQLSIIKGSGKVDIEQWAYDGIIIVAESKRGMSLLLDHAYYPLWDISTDNDAKVSLSPHKRTGQMQLELPKGKLKLTLTRAVSHEMPYINTAIIILAWGLAVMCLYGLLRGTIARWALTKPAPRDSFRP